MVSHAGEWEMCIYETKTVRAQSLFYAAKHGHVWMVRLLVKLGADARARDQYGITVLALASFNGHVEVLRLLVEGGADVRAQNIVNKSTALHSVVVALENATIGGLDHCRLLEAARCLVELGVDINAMSVDGFTALISAAHVGTRAIGHAAMVRLLVALGADMEARSHQSEITALHFAAISRGDVAVVNALLDLGVEAHAKDSEGRTADDKRFGMSDLFNMRQKQREAEQKQHEAKQKQQCEAEQKQREAEQRQREAEQKQEKERERKRNAKERQKRRKVEQLESDLLNALATVTIVVLGSGGYIHQSCVH